MSFTKPLTDFASGFTRDSKDILMASEEQSSSSENGGQMGSASSAANNSVPQKGIKKEVKRPDGMHRELFNLLMTSGKEQSIHSLVPSSTKKGYTNAKIQFGRRQVRKWEWRSFVNPSRKDDLQLKHWQRVGDDPNKVYPFARFNQHLPFLMFSDAEYDDYLQDNRWTKPETQHLLELCRDFDNRWVIIDDRFDRERFKAKKCMVDLKERYYAIHNTLKMIRNVKDNEPALSYDAEHEKRRKEQLVKLWDRTEEQVKEEEDLKVALKRIELKRKERERKACDLQRLINATDRTSLSPDSSSVGGSQAGARAIRRGTTRAPHSVVAQLIAPTDTLNIRFHEFRTSGPHLRSQEMKLPTNIGQKKAKNIDTVIERLKIDTNPHAFEEVVDLYNNFRSNVVLLQDLKTALHSAEGELEALNQRMKAEKGVTGFQAVQTDPRLRVSDPPTDGGEAKAKTTPKLPGDPATSRRITGWIDVNPAGLATARKRKARQFSPGESDATRNAQ